ncbi:MAG: hypothetical protein K1X88_24095 [Nannocystaceae bacterium]|nr:hypothetical protein [Nannocystaceae bacterium]
MSGARQTFAWMAVLSAATLLLGMVRELVIARQMQASEAADLFFRGVVVVNATRSFTLALLRARWIPLPKGPSGAALWRTGLASCGLVAAIATASLAIVIPRGAWLSPESLVFALCVVVAAYGGAVRALSERHGHERLGVIVDWLPPLGTIVGTLVVAHSGGALALGAIGGLSSGLLLAALVLVPSAFAVGERDASVPAPARAPGFALYLDTLVYVNLGLVDSLMSLYVLGDGDFALLSYGYFFVNAILAVPTAGATILALRAGSVAGVAQAAALRRWSTLGAVIAGVGVAVMAAALAWPPLGALVDRAVGWPVADRIDAIVLASAPFAALRLANTIGRQRRVAQDPDGLVVWDLAGLVLRTAALGLGALAFGPVASPLALALAEAVQLGAWWRWQPPPAP